jgi:hypothetical protein
MLNADNKKLTLLFLIGFLLTLIIRVFTVLTVKGWNTFHLIREDNGIIVGNVHENTFLGRPSDGGFQSFTSTSNVSIDVIGSGRFSSNGPHFFDNLFQH